MASQAWTLAASVRTSGEPSWIEAEKTSSSVNEICKGESPGCRVVGREHLIHSAMQQASLQLFGLAPESGSKETPVGLSLSITCRWILQLDAGFRNTGCLYIENDRVLGSSSQWVSQYWQCGRNVCLILMFLPSLAPFSTAADCILSDLSAQDGLFGREIWC
jgi:hypothetical protein